MTDIIVAGGGPAGLTAALYAVRAGRSVLVLEEAAPGGQINFSPLVENYPGLPGVSGLQLSEALTRQAEEQGVELDYAQVLGFRPEEGGFAVETDGGPLHCRALILAPGTRHRPLGLEGEEALTGQGVSYCAVCDGPFYQGRDTAIVGGGDTALQEALFLSGVCRRVTLIHRRLEFRGSPKLAERVRTRDNIRLLLGYTPQALLQAEGRLTGLRVRQASTGQTLELPLDGVFAAVGRVPGTAPFRAQLELDDEGYFRSGEDCRTRLHQIAFSDEERERLEAQYETQKTAAIALAKELSEQRKAASKQFISQVKGELAFLNMPGIAFETEIQRVPLNHMGCDKLQFLVSANKGEPPKPMSKIASGGELSRIMLAIKTVLSGKDKVDTLIFDEVDTGISGAAANKVGQKLKQVSQNRQVLCITHLAQIAALADHHFLISKHVEGERTYTQVQGLDFEGRKREVARIIGGDQVTDLQLEMAGEMLKKG